MNINATQQSYGITQATATAKNADSGNSLPGTASNNGAADTVFVNEVVAFISHAALRSCDFSA